MVVPAANAKLSIRLGGSNFDAMVYSMWVVTMAAPFDLVLVMTIVGLSGVSTVAYRRLSSGRLRVFLTWWCRESTGLVWGRGIGAVCCRRYMWCLVL